MKRCFLTSAFLLVQLLSGAVCEDHFGSLSHYDNATSTLKRSNCAGYTLWRSDAIESRPDSVYRGELTIDVLKREVGAVMSVRLVLLNEDNRQIDAIMESSAGHQALFSCGKIDFVRFSPPDQQAKFMRLEVRYGYNPYFGSFTTNTTTPMSLWGKVCKPTLLIQIKKPGIKVMLSDIRDYSNSELRFVRYYDNVFQENDGGRAYYCHSLQCNFVFVDGHSSAMSQTSVGKKFNATSTEKTSTQYWLWPDYDGDKE